MPLRVTVDLLDASYQASTLDRAGAEWPPHPARIFCALVSVADPADPVQDAALRWLEEQPAPLVRVPAACAEGVRPRMAWVPTNAVVKDPGHAVLPGRASGGPKAWPQRTLAQPVVEFEWAADPPLGVLAVLEVLAKKVPYLGRASGHALVRAEATPADQTDGRDGGGEEWESVGHGSVRADAVGLRTPYAGYLRRLREAYAQGQPAWECALSTPYARRGVAEPVVEEVAAGPFEDLVAFSFPAGFSLDASLTMAVTGALRRKVMGLLEEAGHDVEAMVAVHGHKSDPGQGRACAYLGLPFVGHTHADGRLRGVAVALPRDLDGAHRRALLAILLRAGGGLRKLAVPTVSRPVSLAYVAAGGAEVNALWSVRPGRWTRPSREWTTALPMVLDRFPKPDGRDIEKLVAVSCRLAGLPEPAEVHVLRRGALLPGAAELPAAALRRKGGERPLPSRHVRLRFGRPVSGPVVLGSKKNFGLGLCLPTDAREEQA